ncbi:MAG: GNAT family N-acetyltransferase [Planctomycetes bacterium]|nr:GNAT family N-acetyltransferase [Planctomycetota bacterium]
MPAQLRKGDSPVLQTERLVLRFPQPEDAAAMARYVIENREHLRKGGPARDGNYYTDLYWLQMAEDIDRDWRADRHCHFILFDKTDNRTPLGRARLSDFLRGALHGCNLGYEIAKSHEGRGLMTEALQAAIAHGFGPLNLHRIQAAYRPANLRSGRVLERLGFVKEGIAAAYLRVDGRWEDHVVTSLTNPHWRDPDH